MIDKDKAVRLYKTGLTMQEVGDRLGCTREYVRLCCTARGVFDRHQSREQAEALLSRRREFEKYRAKWHDRSVSGREVAAAAGLPLVSMYEHLGPRGVVAKRGVSYADAITPLWVKGLTVREIADLIGRSRGSVSQAILGARRRGDPRFPYRRSYSAVLRIREGAARGLTVRVRRGAAAGNGRRKPA